MLHVLTHPLADHIVTHLRDKTTKPATFRTLAYQLTLLLAVEATRNLSTEDRVIETPLETHTGRVLSHDTLVVAAILRAGVGMVQPFVDTFPSVSVGYIGLERDHETAIARSYYLKLPPISGHRVFVIDPMLATGGSAIQAISVVKEHGAVKPTFLCIVAAPEGVEALAKAHPDVDIYTAALDRALNERKYILPGLGDFGDRLYGT